MRHLIAGTVLLLLGCDAGSVAAPEPPAFKTDRVSSLQYTIPLNTAVFVPCANDNQGEMVVIEGTQTWNFFVNAGPDDTLQRVRIRMDGVGTGEVTGATWDLRHIEKDIWHRTAEGRYSDHWTALAFLRGEGSAPDFHTQFMQFYRVDQAGNLLRGGSSATWPPAGDDGGGGQAERLSSLRHRLHYRPHRMPVDRGLSREYAPRRARQVRGATSAGTDVVSPQPHSQ